MATPVLEQVSDVIQSSESSEQIRKLEAEVARLQQVNEKLAAQCLATEQEEEFLTNKLLKRLEILKQEKQAVVLQLEQEEEYLTNTLQKKLQQLTQEKVDLENKLEQEEEYIVNKLQKQLSLIQEQRDKLKHQLDQEAEAHKLDCKQFNERNESLKKELHQLKTDNFLLKQKILSEREKFNHVINEKLQLETRFEMGLERAFNEESRKRRGRSMSNPLQPSLSDPFIARTRSTITGQPPQILSGATLTRRASLTRITPPASPRDVQQISPTPPRTPQSPEQKTAKRKGSKNSPTLKYITSPMQHLEVSGKELKREWVRLKVEDRWVRQQLAIFGSGELCCLVEETSMRWKLDLDKVTELIDVSQQFGDFSLKVSTSEKTSLIINFENQATFTAWRNLLKELSPSLSHSFTLV